MLVVRHCTHKQAKAWIKAVHRHHTAPQGAILFLAAWDVPGPGELGAARPVGVAALGRTVARMADDGQTVEVTRVAAIEGAPKGTCSKLLAACWKTARAMGYRRILTYTLPEEGGASLRGAGWTPTAASRGGSWSRSGDGRQRTDPNPTSAKQRWECSTHDYTPGAWKLTMRDVVPPGADEPTPAPAPEPAPLTLL